MSVSEKAAVLRERAAWEAGFGALPFDAINDPRERAARLYPLPKVTRPRVLPDPYNGGATEWAIIGDSMCIRLARPCSEWMRWSSFRESSDSAPLEKRVQMWADLWANPTEDVEDDA